MDTNEESQILVRKAQGGDRTAFDDLVRHYRARLESLIGSRLGTSLGGSSEIPDVLQEVLLRAYEAMDRFQWRDSDAFFRWLSGIGLNVIRERAGRRKRERLEPLHGEIADGTVSPSKEMRRDERFDRLDEALDALCPDYREVLLLVRVEGLPVKEAAQRMNRTPHAVSNLLLRATRKLKETFGETGSLKLPHRRFRRNEKRDHHG